MPSPSALRRSREGVRIRVDPDDVDVRVKALDQQHEGPRAAADLENALTRSNCALVEQRSRGSVAAKEPHERIVERQEAVVAGCGKTRPRGPGGQVISRAERAQLLLAALNATHRAAEAARVHSRRWNGELSKQFAAAVARDIHAVAQHVGMALKSTKTQDVWCSAWSPLQPLRRF
jgi:hypothetical protein